MEAIQAWFECLSESAQAFVVLTGTLMASAYFGWLAIIKFDDDYEWRLLHTLSAIPGTAMLMCLLAWWVTISIMDMIRCLP